MDADDRRRRAAAADVFRDAAARLEQLGWEANQAGDLPAGSGLVVASFQLGAAADEWTLAALERDQDGSGDARDSWATGDALRSSRGT